MDDKEKKKKNLSIFKITCIVLTIILVVAIVVQICILVNLKIKTDDLKRKNQEITSITQIVNQ